METEKLRVENDIRAMGRVGGCVVKITVAGCAFAIKMSASSLPQ